MANLIEFVSLRFDYLFRLVCLMVEKYVISLFGRTRYSTLRMKKISWPDLVFVSNPTNLDSLFQRIDVIFSLFSMCFGCRSSRL